MNEYTHHLTVITRNRDIGNALAVVLSGKQADAKTFDYGIPLVKTGESEVSAYAATVQVTTGGAVIVQEFLNGGDSLLLARGATPELIAAARDCLDCRLDEKGAEISAKDFFASHGYAREPHKFLLPTAEGA